MPAESDADAPGSPVVRKDAEASLSFSLHFGGGGAPASVKHFTLKAGHDVLRIGRCEKSDVVVSLPGVSWAHCELRLAEADNAEGARLLLVDQSSNHTGLKIPGGPISKVNKGVPTMVPSASVVVLPMKVKPQPDTPVDTQRVCFEVVFNEPTPEHVVPGSAPVDKSVDKAPAPAEGPQDAQAPPAVTPQPQTGVQQAPLTVGQPQMVPQMQTPFLTAQMLQQQYQGMPGVNFNASGGVLGPIGLPIGYPKMPGPGNIMMPQALQQQQLQQQQQQLQQQQLPQQQQQQLLQQQLLRQAQAMWPGGNVQYPQGYGAMMGGQVPQQSLVLNSFAKAQIGATQGAVQLAPTAKALMPVPRGLLPPPLAPPPTASIPAAAPTGKELANASRGKPMEELLGQKADDAPKGGSAAADSADKRRSRSRRGDRRSRDRRHSRSRSGRRDRSGGRGGDRGARDSNRDRRRSRSRSGRKESEKDRDRHDRGKDSERGRYERKDSDYSRDRRTEANKSDGGSSGGTRWEKPVNLVAPEFPVGTEVEAFYRMKWYPGQVAKVVGSTHHVNVDGKDFPMEAKDLRLRRTPAASSPAAPAPASAAAPPAAPSGEEQAQYKVGDEVQARWRDEWFDGKVTEVLGKGRLKIGVQNGRDYEMDLADVRRKPGSAVNDSTPDGEKVEDVTPKPDVVVDLVETAPPAPAAPPSPILAAAPKTPESFRPSKSFPAVVPEAAGVLGAPAASVQLAASAPPAAPEETAALEVPVAPEAAAAPAAPAAPQPPAAPEAPAAPQPPAVPETPVVPEAEASAAPESPTIPEAPVALEAEGAPAAAAAEPAASEAPEAPEAPAAEEPPAPPVPPQPAAPEEEGYKAGDDVQAKWRNEWSDGKVVEVTRMGRIKVIVDGRPYDYNASDVRRKPGAAPEPSADAGTGLKRGAEEEAEAPKERKRRTGWDEQPAKEVQTASPQIADWRPQVEDWRPQPAAPPAFAPPPQPFEGMSHNSLAPPPTAPPMFAPPTATPPRPAFTPQITHPMGAGFRQWAAVPTPINDVAVVAGAEQEQVDNEKAISVLRSKASSFVPTPSPQPYAFGGGATAPQNGVSAAGVSEIDRGVADVASPPEMTLNQVFEAAGLVLRPKGGGTPWSPPPSLGGAGGMPRQAWRPQRKVW